jgi:hypothetical protein
MYGDVALGIHPEVAQSPAAHVVELLGVFDGPARGGDSRGDEEPPMAANWDCNAVEEPMKAGVVTVASPLQGPVRRLAVRHFARSKQLFSHRVTPGIPTPASCASLQLLSA